MNMRFTTLFLSTLIVATASAATTNPSSSLRGSGMRNTIRQYRGFDVTVGSTINSGCSRSAPEQGDFCSKYQQQCLYPIMGSDNGEILNDGSFWACNCDSDIDIDSEEGQYNCGITCFGSECIGTKQPSAAPVSLPVGGRTRQETAPPNYSWCPVNHPGHNSGCQFVGVECGYLKDSSVVDCMCKTMVTERGKWSKLWQCNGV